MPLPSSASYSGMMAPPGYPKARSTPSARKHRKTISAPLSIHHLLWRRLGHLHRFFRLPARQPTHHAAQLRSDNLNGMLLLLLAQLGEVVAAVFVFLDPFASEGSVLNVGQSFLHRGAGQTAAQHGLFAEQIALGFFLKGGLEHAGASRADAMRVG